MQQCAHSGILFILIAILFPLGRENTTTNITQEDEIEETRDDDDNCSLLSLVRRTNSDDSDSASDEDVDDKDVDDDDDDDEDYSMPALYDPYYSDSDDESDDDLDSFFENIHDESDNLDSDTNQGSNEVRSCRFKRPGRKVGSTRFETLTKARALEAVKSAVASEIAEKRKHVSRLPRNTFKKVIHKHTRNLPYKFKISRGLINQRIKRKSLSSKKISPV